MQRSRPFPGRLLQRTKSSPSTKLPDSFAATIKPSETLSPEGNSPVSFDSGA